MITEADLRAAHEQGAAQALQDQRKSALSAYIERFGLPPEVTGPMLERFDAAQLAAAIESELGRARVMGYEKITLTMGLMDAFCLARFLRGDKD